MFHISFSIIILLTATSAIFAPQDNGLESMILQDRPLFKAELKLSSEEDEESYVQWYDEGKYKDRKFKAVNSHLKTILSIAFQIPEEQILVESPLPLDHYTMKVVVPEGKESLLRSTIEETIEAKIGINIKHELRNAKVVVLRSLETGLMKIGKTSSSNGSSFHRGVSKINCKATSMDDFARLLSTSSLNMIVVNDTGLEGLYDLEIEWRKGDTNSLQNELDKLGLNIEFEDRSVEILVTGSSLN